MSVNMDEVLDMLADDATAEEAFASGLAKEAEEEKAEASQQEEEEVEKTASEEEEDSEEQEKTAENKSQEESEEEMRKTAKRADEEGRVMARSFFDELQKLGVAPTAEYPSDPGAVPINRGVEVPRGEAAQPHAEQTSKVNQIIAQLTTSNKVGAGEVGTSAQVEPQKHTAPQEAPVAADIMKAEERKMTGEGQVVKTGSAKILTNLYNEYFPEEDE